MDGKDFHIIGHLLQDARTPLSQISESLGVSNAAIHQRIKKLEEANVITGSQITIDEKSLGLRTICFVGVYLERAGHNHEVATGLKDIPEVLECYFTTGAYSLLLKVACKDNYHLMKVLSEGVQVIPGVARTETFIVLESRFRRPIHIDAI